MPKSKAKEDKHVKGTPQLLGNTTANQVYKVDYKKGKGFSGKGSQTGYLKEDTDQTVAKYAVSASRLAQGIGMGSLIPETTYAEHTVPDGKGGTRQIKGAVSRGFDGEALSSPVYDVDKHDEFLGSLTPKTDINFAAGMNNVKNVNGRWMGQAGDEINDLDLSKSNTQKGLNDLQWFDALIGNVDRHGGNILIDPETGNVQGIDNDLSFKLGQSAKSGNSVDENFVMGNDEKYLGLPSLIDKKTAKTLLKLNEKKIRKMLTPKGVPDDEKLTEREIKQVLDRLEVVQDHIRNLEKNGGVVSKWDQTTYQKQINEDVSGRATNWNKNPIAGSYLQRHDVYMQRAQDPNNDKFWRKGHRGEDIAPAQPTPQVAQTQAPTQPVPQPTQVPQPAQPTGWQRPQTGANPQPRMRLGGSRGNAPVSTSTAQTPQPTPPPQPTVQPAPPTRPRSDSRTGGLTLQERKQRLFGTTNV